MGQQLCEAGDGVLAGDVLLKEMGLLAGCQLELLAFSFPFGLATAMPSRVRIHRRSSSNSAKVARIRISCWALRSRMSVEHRSNARGQSGHGTREGRGWQPVPDAVTIDVALSRAVRGTVGLPLPPCRIASQSFCPCWAVRLGWRPTFAPLRRPLITMSREDAIDEVALHAVAQLFEFSGKPPTYMKLAESVDRQTRERTRATYEKLVTEMGLPPRCSGSSTGDRTGRRTCVTSGTTWRAF